MDYKNYASQEALDIIRDLKTDAELGLSSINAKERLKKDGLNSFNFKKLSWLNILWRQFASPFIYMLIAASILSFILQQWLEGIMIFVFLLINATLGFFQEYRSEKTAKLLSDLITWRARVLRNGKLKVIDASQLVIGDILILETGDKISADGRILEAYGFSTNESSLTGESIAISKHPERMITEISDLTEAVNMVFSGTSVNSGRAKILITATGRRSVIGQIANLSAKTKKITSFATSINSLSNFIVKLVLITLIFVFILNIAIKGSDTNWIELLIFSIALAIGVIPEALPLVMTFSFSKGALKLAKHKVIIKRLSSIEDLGNIEILCSDKTGTLTEGKLKVFDVYSLNNDKDQVLTNAFLAASDQSQKTDAFDLSLKKAINKNLINRIKKVKVLFNTPFDPKFLRNNALVQVKGGFDFIVRGAPEVIIELSSNLKKTTKFSVQEWIASQGKLGRRTIAVAKRHFKTLNLENFRNNFHEEENDLEFLGLISFADNVKKSTLETIQQANELDVKLKIITGDSREVAGAIAFEIGLIQNPSEVLLASELDKMKAKEKKAAISKYHVFARVTPDKKHEIIKILQENHSVGYLGDGINDAPALKAAGVSLAVDNAADVAREAADVILTESDLNVIIEGIKEGRKIFINSAKYIKSTLASNFGNFYAVAIATLLIPFLPMLPLQILLMNLLSDFPMIAIATDNVDDTELASPKKYQSKDILLIAMILGVVSTIFDFVFFALFKNISPGVLQTNWFIGSILTELAFLFSIRTKGFMFKSKRPSNLIFSLTGIAALSTIVIPFTVWGQKLFNFIPPTFNHLLIILMVMIAFIICSESVKIFYYRNKRLSG